MSLFIAAVVANLESKRFADSPAALLLYDAADSAPTPFGSVAELVDTTNLYLAKHNLEAKRYVWHVDGQEVLPKIQGNLPSTAWASL
jgi:hypothetical protein